MTRAGLVLAVALLAGCDYVSPRFQVGDCIGLTEFDHMPLLVLRVGKEAYEVRYVSPPYRALKPKGLRFATALVYERVHTAECEVQP